MENVQVKTKIKSTKPYAFRLWESRLYELVDEYKNLCDGTEELKAALEAVNAKRVECALHEFAGELENWKDAHDSNTEQYYDIAEDCRVVLEAASDFWFEQTKKTRPAYQYQVFFEDHEPMFITVPFLNDDGKLAYSWIEHVASYQGKKVKEIVLLDGGPLEQIEMTNKQLRNIKNDAFLELVLKDMINRVKSSMDDIDDWRKSNLRNEQELHSFLKAANSSLLTLSLMAAKGYGQSAQFGRFTKNRT